jgi:superoxide dismutase, Fe-Mn family
LAKSSDLLKPIVDLQANATAAGSTIRNNAGGHYNHALFWTIMAPPQVASTTKPSVQLASLIKSSFGNQFNMISVFNKLAAPASTFGSGWVWLCVNSAGTKLVIVNTQNQDNPLMVGVTAEPLYPILGLDVWEHAYYLKYNNLRDTYVANFWKLVDWKKVSEYAAYAVANKKGVSL